MTKVRPIYLRFLTFAVIILGLVWVNNLRSSRTKAGPLSSTSVTMSNSRLSYRGQVDGNPAASNIIDIKVGGITDYVDGTDEYTDGLVVGDTLVFNDATTPSGSRTIQEIIDANTIRVSTALSVTDEPFYMAQTTDLVVQFTTNSVIAGTGTLAGGYFEVLVPSAATDNDDGIPDQDLFDFNDPDSTVTCTGSNHGTFGYDTDPGATGFREGDRGDTTNPIYNTTNDYHSDNWHAYRCHYDGSGAVNETITMTISNLVNPAPAADHDTGVADTYDIIVRHMNGNGTAADETDDIEFDATWTKIGAIEAVQVSARVVPILTFSIEGVAATTTACGVSTSVTTTADSVPLGVLDTATFTNAAQLLEVTTNAPEGASVTAIANDQLGLNGGTCTGDTYLSGVDAYTCIWDANVTNMTHQDSSGTAGEQDWDTSTTSPGFAFSLDQSGGLGTTNPDFEYNQSSGGFFARHFADAENSQDPQLIFDTNGDPTNDDDTFVCYRAKVDAVTAAGYYYNYITYTATATF